ncbi:protein NRT1/ PTR FAMILY 5.6-like [Lycium barbarum]|uniref:protein NRT1/ PTR FAMILY 5.6-like n=1 Tax=Lycium barbarum TaxID=112863 RepID=UPI00293EBBB4|nr:protein NRT1/ PTR FAMILY 5.6-like [Lycium barbarum]
MLAILINHLTDYWEVTLPKAGQIVNVHEGLTSLLVIVVAQLSDSYFGRLKLILFTNTAFIFGLMMLWYESHRLSIKALFGALALLTLGKAGRDVTLKAFLADQLRISREEPNLEEEELIETRRKLIWRFCWILGIIMATVWLSNEEWEALAKICTIAMAAGFFVFLLGIPFYKHEDTFPSPILNAFNVVKAAVLKGHLNYPASPNQLFKNYSTSATKILPHIAFLRWLDKAAILEPSPPCPISTKQVETGRLFEVAKVKDVKRLIIACVVEVHRLHRVNVEDSQISIFWLTPQFFLVGLMKGLSESGLQDFFETQVCESMKEYGPQFSEFSDGIGKFFSVICILIFHFCNWYANQPHDQSETDDNAQELQDGVADDNAQELQDGVANENSGFEKN